MSVITNEAALTEPENAAPPELVMVTVPMLVPTAPPTVTAAVVLMTRFATGAAPGPEMAAVLMTLAEPVPRVRVLLEEMAALARVRVAAPGSRVAF